jgi:lysophospholipase L1-like esterase
MVVPVNMFDDWKDEYFADDVHYNAEGAKEVARRYFQVIDSLLLEK